MRRTIYLQMLYIINMYRSWIVVDDGYGYRQSVVFRRGRPVSCVCRMLRLRSTYKHNGYERASYLEAKDVEAIIEIATYGLVKLELTELPLFKQY